MNLLLRLDPNNMEHPTHEITMTEEDINSIDITLTEEMLKDIEDIHFSDPNPCV